MNETIESILKRRSVRSYKETQVARKIYRLLNSETNMERNVSGIKSDTFFCEKNS